MTNYSSTRKCSVCGGGIYGRVGRRTKHEECKTPAEKAAHKRHVTRHARESSLNSHQHVVNGPSEPVVAKHRTPLCQACMNLPHARPKEGCPPRTLSEKGKLLTCGLPYSDEERIRPHVAGYSLIAAAQRDA